MTKDLPLHDDWIPSSCTLPTMEQPLRRAEFAALFADGALEVEQTPSSEIVVTLKPEAEVAARAARLATAETGCCSFFTFRFTISPGRVDMIISAEPDHADILVALATRATSLVGTPSARR